MRDSDEAIVAVLHHETHEIEALRDVFLEGFHYQLVSIEVW